MPIRKQISDEEEPFLPEIVDTNSSTQKLKLLKAIIQEQEMRDFRLEIFKNFSNLKSISLGVKVISKNKYKFSLFL